MIGQTRALQWLEFVSYCQNISIEQKYNTKEIRFGQHNLPVCFGGQDTLGINFMAAYFIDV